MYNVDVQNNFDEISQNENFSLQDKINISIKAAQKLANLHTYGTFHNQLNSKVFIHNNSIDEVVLSSQSKYTFCNLEDISYNKLYYLSPEQTGRINRTTDYRTDLYSFGIILFKLFTNRYPFEHNDPLKIIHSHIAQTPPLACDIDSTVPKNLSLIIEKLLYKDPEERYQSANGLCHDLTLILEQFNLSDSSDFELATKDISHRPNIPEKLYGREKEVETLIKQFEKVLDMNQKEVVSISGYSGIGKSSLINILNKPIRHNGAYFLNGKYKQSKNSIPYYGLTNALRDFINYILLEKESRLNDFKQLVADKPGDNVRLICEIIPELNYIITGTKALPTLNPVETQNRFNITFLTFIRLICEFEETVVLCLDDLQWADSATIKMVQNIIEDSSINNILILLSYRSNEVKKSHRLSLMFEELTHKNIVYTDIRLTALQSIDVNNILCDTLDTPIRECKELAELIKHKTSGNPFFTKKFILNLYDEKLLYIDKQKMKWSWDFEKIKEQKISDNVALLILKKLSKLNSETLEVIKFISCLTKKTISNIAAISDFELEKIEKAIKESIEAEILLPISKQNQSEISYKFSHDKVHEAVLFLLKEKEKELFNLKIGYHIINSLKSEQETENKIFDITDHLNLGCEQIVERSEKNQLVQYNYTAANKAKETNAYDNAISYLNKIFELLKDESPWKENYTFILKVYVLLSEVYYLNSDFKNAKHCFDVVLKNATSINDTIEICQIQIYALIAQNKMKESLDLGLDILDKFGIILPEEDDINAYYPKLFSLYNEEKIGDLINLPNIKDIEKSNIIDILNSIMAPAYLAQPILYPKICYVAVKLSIENGICAATANVFSVHALLLCGCFGQHKQGFAFSKLSQEIVKKFESTKYSCKVEMISNACVVHWNEHIHETLTPLKKSILIGIDNGDIEYSCYSAMYYCLYSLLSGKNIDELLVEFNSYLNLMKELQQEYQIHYLSIWNQFLLNLKNSTKNPLELEGEIFSEKQMLKTLQDNNNVSTLYCFYLAKAMLGLFYDDILSAYTHINRAKEYLVGVSSLYHFNEFYFYESLITYSYYKEYVDLSEEKTLEVLTNNSEYYESLLETSPLNNSYKYNLIKALIATLTNDNSAWSYYELASKESGEQKFTYANAVCNLYAASFWFESGMKDFAYTYIQKAYDSLRSWGANILTDVLIKKYPKHFAQSIDNLNSFNLANFDFESVMKASQAISEEISLEELLNKIMKIIVENSGSQLGFLLLQHEKKLVVEAAFDIVTKSKTRDLNTVINMPKSIINYVKRSEKPVIYSASSNDKLFRNDKYILSRNPKSVFCLPIVYKKEFLGILYLENRDIHNLYTEEKIEFLKLLSHQAAISIDHAKLFKQTLDHTNTLELTVSEKTKELQHAVDELRVYATVDAMTGLNNRRYFFELATNMFYKARNNRQSLHAFVLDIDDFKVINDTYGHSIGDQAIKAFAKTLLMNECDNCITGRFGGDEFVILTLNQDEENITEMVREIKQRVSNIKLNYANSDIELSTSVGYAILSDKINSLDELILEADKHMYQDKKNKNSRKAVRQRR